ncbi:hypothetical protein SPRG_03767 [Saprolegnia parasitica CBS 223.65]|uniref:Uncharacterized protein n=1 Tax=Saprolegnia parasitica (strain CBS 223.65) TaxID=695850 RepID=A0A067CYG7_SAPPC|nr:hypothetical protein SPRG_03767 [Saprolegnia parasitica CBS 223.65]KDO31847.1 hypothetical protein SPRG_03767 [Saprolegnia parasitica CBS 223.65]|eukprot:XP_012197726.1 hypothetical protein SPRG_03767 [Saprolegnia parasitica CBS 223.65]
MTDYAKERADVYADMTAPVAAFDGRKILSVAANFALPPTVPSPTPMPYPLLGEADVVRLICSPLPAAAAALSRRIGEEIAAIFESETATQTYVNTEASMHVTLFHTSHPDACLPFSPALRAEEVRTLKALISSTPAFALTIHSVILAASGTVLLLFEDPTNAVQHLRSRAKATFGSALRHPNHIIHSTLSRVLTDTVSPACLAAAIARCKQLTAELAGQRVEIDAIWYVEETHFYSAGSGQHEKIAFGTALA